MIYHKWKTILVGVPKAGSTSLHIMFSNKTDYNMGRDGHDHDTIFEIFQNNDYELIQDYKSVACVRNPYDRFFSAWKHGNQHYKTLSRDDLKSEFKNFVNWFSTQTVESDIKMYAHYQHQRKFICFNQKILVDWLFHIETLSEDVERFKQEFNQLEIVPYPFIKCVTKENVMETTIPYNEIYDEDMANKIYNYYKSDFKIFGYEKNSWKI